MVPEFKGGKSQLEQPYQSFSTAYWLGSRAVGEIPDCWKAKKSSRSGCDSFVERSRAKKFSCSGCDSFVDKSMDG
jgi:hypothetical protein